MTARKARRPLMVANSTPFNRLPGTVDRFCRSVAAAYMGIDTSVMPEVAINLRYLGDEIWWLLNDRSAGEIMLLAAYLPPELAVRYGLNSDNMHTQGRALDVAHVSMTPEALRQQISNWNIPYDGICIECNHVHIEAGPTTLQPLRARMKPPSWVPQR